MKVRDIVNSKFVNDSTTLIFRDNFHVVLEVIKVNLTYMLNEPVEHFTWQDDNKVFIDLREDWGNV